MASGVQQLINDISERANFDMGKRGAFHRAIESLARREGLFRGHARRAARKLTRLEQGGRKVSVEELRIPEAEFQAGEEGPGTHRVMRFYWNLFFQAKEPVETERLV